MVVVVVVVRGWIMRAAVGDSRFYSRRVSSSRALDKMPVRRQLQRRSTLRRMGLELELYLELACRVVLV